LSFATAVIVFAPQASDTFVENVPSNATLVGAPLTVRLCRPDGVSLAVPSTATEAVETVLFSAGAPIVSDGASLSTLTSTEALLAFPALSKTEPETPRPAAGVEVETVRSGGQLPSIPDSASEHVK
jgi:hypothetical protein